MAPSRRSSSSGPICFRASARARSWRGLEPGLREDLGGRRPGDDRVIGGELPTQHGKEGGRDRRQAAGDGGQGFQADARRQVSAAAPSSPSATPETFILAPLPWGSGRPRAVSTAWRTSSSSLHVRTSRTPGSHGLGVCFTPDYHRRSERALRGPAVATHSSSSFWIGSAAASRASNCSIASAFVSAGPGSSRSPSGPASAAPHSGCRPAIQAAVSASNGVGVEQGGDDFGSSRAPVHLVERDQGGAADARGLAVQAAAVAIGSSISMRA